MNDAPAQPHAARTAAGLAGILVAVVTVGCGSIGTQRNGPGDLTRAPPLPPLRQTLLLPSSQRSAQAATPAPAAPPWQLLLPVPPASPAATATATALPAASPVWALPKITPAPEAAPRPWWSRLTGGAQRAAPSGAVGVPIAPSRATEVAAAPAVSLAEQRWQALQTYRASAEEAQAFAARAGLSAPVTPSSPASLPASPPSASTPPSLRMLPDAPNATAIAGPAPMPPPGWAVRSRVPPLPAAPVAAPLPAVVVKP